MTKRFERRASNAGVSRSLTDDSLLGSLSSPALTSVRVDYTESARRPPRRFLAEIDGIRAPTYNLWPLTLESRASTAATTVDEDLMKHRHAPHIRRVLGTRRESGDRPMRRRS